ncbi:hypothetical protein AFCDBAGC_2061 [Methylobacterium cerastii]|uniref:Protein NO VEIN C-terminal domain-containing protein n=1 Tax=Methylobacterium cerastii TaxID=932741 RepID=A0ABQ4QH23_9HYPH|nr:DUF3883 domain-containing protein [Methylobacterium cerastii]GJD44197.1 hypothetical protein AFCDBAGC_2061 [Methylobacterium cerastii]
MHLGMPCIQGYKPMANFQRALIDGVERYLGARPAMFDSPVVATHTAGLSETESLFFYAPPTPGFQPTPAPLERIVKKFDPALRDAHNRALGRQGEERILLHERASLRAAGRADLARIARVAQEDGDGAGYDIRSFDLSGRERLIEVKTTIGQSTTPFFLPKNERAFAQERTDAFRIARL